MTLPPMQFSGGSASSSLNSAGSSYGAPGGGDWIVNFGGTQDATGSGGNSGISPVLLVAAVVVLWFILKK